MKVVSQPSSLPGDPLVSVIVPSFNQGAFIREAIESCLAQDYRPIEIIVIDGASKDNTIEVLQSLADVSEVCWVSEPDRGPVEAVNKGLALARGMIGLIQSADDQSTPGAFRLAVQRFQADERVGLVYGDVELMDSAGMVIQYLDVGKFSLKGLLSRCTWVPQPCAFFRLELARALGGWDERFPYCPDTDLWFRLALSARVSKVSHFLGRTRAHAGQRDKRKRAVYESYERMVRESEPLVRSSRACRRALRAGLEIVKLRYNPGLTDGQLCRALWTAVMLHPPLVLSAAMPRHRLVPGYFRWAGWVGSLRRRMGWCRNKCRTGTEAR